MGFHESQGVIKEESKKNSGRLLEHKGGAAVGSMDSEWQGEDRNRSVRGERTASGFDKSGEMWRKKGREKGKVGGDQRGEKRIADMSHCGNWDWEKKTPSN